MWLGQTMHTSVWLSCVSVDILLGAFPYWVLVRSASSVSSTVPHANIFAQLLWELFYNTTGSRQQHQHWPQGCTCTGPRAGPVLTAHTHLGSAPG